MAKIKIGNLKPPLATIEKEGISRPDGVTIGIENGILNSLVKADSLEIIDSTGLIGETGQTSNTQELIDIIADKVMNKLVEKTMISNTNIDDANKIPTSALLYNLQDQVTQLYSNLSKILTCVKISGTFLSTTADVTIPYPPGFDISNVFACNLKVNISSDRYDNVPSSNYPSSNSVSFRSDNIYIHNNDSRLYSKKFELLLFKL